MLKENGTDVSATEPEINEEHSEPELVGEEKSEIESMSRDQKEKANQGYLFTTRRRNRNAIINSVFITLRLVVVLLLVCAMAGGGLVVGVAKAYMDTSPVLDLSALENTELTSFIYDGDGNVITTLSGLENRIYAKIDEIPEYLQKAIVAIEDDRFWDHNGVNLKRIAGAFLSNLSSSSTQGGSTITQQLVKLELLSSERTYKRKIQEAWLAMQLELEYEKPQILEAYLNAIPLANANFGVKAAAQDYFGKELDQLTLRECAMLAGMAQSPYTYDPRANTYERKKMDLTDRRTDTVLMKMYETGVISKAEYEQGLAETVYIQPKSKQQSMYDMPYIVEYAIYDVITALLEKRGLEDTQYNRSLLLSELRKGGYHIYTTIDSSVQKIVEETLFNWEKYPSVRYTQDKYTLSKTSDSSFTKIEQPQAAAVVIDYHAGEVKAMVGGRTQPTQKMTLNRAYQSHMPVGSTIKPLTVYGPALERGLSPASVSLNLPVKVNGWDNERGYPNNYGGGGFTDACTLRMGLKKSLNVVAARVLMDDVGIDNAAQYLEKMGITNGVNRDGAGLALGTSGITPLEMAAAYGSLGNGGVYLQPLAFRQVLDKNGNVVLDAEQIRKSNVVFKESTVYMLLDMMKEAIESGTGTGAKIKGMTVAGKTGTNSDSIGVSFSGLTPYYSASVWIGHDDYKPLYNGAQGGKDAAPLWQAFMAKIHEGLENKSILDVNPSDLGLVRVKTCSLSGKLATEACELDPDHKPLNDWWQVDNIPKEECDMHVNVRICPESGKLATPYCPLDPEAKSAVTMIPTDSPILTMKEENIKKYFPNALYNLPEGLFTMQNAYQNVKYSAYFCPLHDEQWDSIEKFNLLKQEASQTIDDIQQRMSVAVWMTEDVIDTLKTMIRSVENSAELGKDYYNELRRSLDNLQEYAKSAFSAQP